MLNGLLKVRYRGSSLAWTAVLLSIVVLPLMILVSDGTRLYYVRSRLAQATDAACADVSWSLADRQAWQMIRNDRYLSSGLIAQAHNTFSQMLVERATVKYSANLELQFDWENARVECRAQAQVPLLMTGQNATIQIRTNAKMRFFSP